MPRGRLCRGSDERPTPCKQMKKFLWRSRERVLAVYAFEIEKETNLLLTDPLDYMSHVNLGLNLPVPAFLA